MKRVGIAIVLLLVGITKGWAVEEDLDLDKITNQAAPVTIPKMESSKYTLMGRLDLTAEVNPLQAKSVDNKSEFKNLHGLKLFLKLKASPQTSFFGEIANQDFYYVDYHPWVDQTLSFGKILVPFGDTRFFHHFYGGIQGKGAQGIMFPNVWAEPGFNWQIQLPSLATVDLYLVNGVKALSASTFPDLRQAADKQRQAVGTRLQWQGIEHVTLIASAYGDYYWENRGLLILGGDIYTDYGLLSWPLRFAAGFANASAEKVSGQGTLQRRGDYLMFAGKSLGNGEWRLRYGTYNDVTAQKSSRDSHSFDIAYSFNVDVIRLMVERQWNFEAINEIDDDVLRLMASLDF